jgi:hypothetical protein
VRPTVPVRRALKAIEKNMIATKKANIAVVVTRMADSPDV